jgi:hypothetical protein
MSQPAASYLWGIGDLKEPARLIDMRMMGMNPEFIYAKT